MTPISTPPRGLDALFESNDSRWRAVLDRDGRSDGLVYYGVASTGIYCRPVCSARRPRRANVSFYRTCEEAEAAGFRACKLCRPAISATPSERHGLAVRPAAVLFVDIVGFSRYAATRRPDEALALTREFHARTEAVLQAHGGVAHKLLGDGVMAVFGLDRSRPSDARRALASAMTLAETVASWSSSRVGDGDTPVAIGIGVNYGMTAFGQAGHERAVIGDAVNVASRLEHATRRLGETIAVSDEVVRAISSPHRQLMTDRLRSAGIVNLPGCKPRRVWTWSPRPAVAGETNQGDAARASAVSRSGSSRPPHRRR